MKGLVEGVHGSGRDQDWFSGAEFLIALALFGFGLLLFEFELLLVEVGFRDGTLRVDQLEIEFGFFFETLVQRDGVEAVQNRKHLHGGDVHGRLEEDVWGVLGHGLGVFELEFQVFEKVGDVRLRFRGRGLWFSVHGSWFRRFRFRFFQHGELGGHGVHGGRLGVDWRWISRALTRRGHEVIGEFEHGVHGLFFLKRMGAPFSEFKTGRPFGSGLWKPLIFNGSFFDPGGVSSGNVRFWFSGFTTEARRSRSSSGVLSLVSGPSSVRGSSASFGGGAASDASEASALSRGAATGSAG